MLKANTSLHVIHFNPCDDNNAVLFLQCKAQRPIININKNSRLSQFDIETIYICSHISRLDSI